MKTQKENGCVAQKRYFNGYSRITSRSKIYWYKAPIIPNEAEQKEAVDKTYSHYHSIWQEDMNAVPRFLWNAKMRFGKTFASYQLAKKLGAKRVLVVTFKPAVEDAWQSDLESHVDFDGWQYLSRNSDSDPTQISRSKPVVYFGSFQDLLGRDKYGNIKPKNQWIHKVKWDLVILDEYHFGAWRDTAKELFEGEDIDSLKQEFQREFSNQLELVNHGIGDHSLSEKEILPITTRSYLYLSGTPFRALSTGEFIEEQIFNWTYTDEQRAKAQFTTLHPDDSNPYAALPEMRLFTYQMPDEILAVANMGEFDEFDLNSFFEASNETGEAIFKHKSEVQSGSTLFEVLISLNRLNTSKSVQNHHSLTLMSACYRIYSIRSGSYQMWHHAKQWQICLLRNIMCFGTITLSK